MKLLGLLFLVCGVAAGDTITLVADASTMSGGQDSADASIVIELATPSTVSPAGVAQQDLSVSFPLFSLDSSSGCLNVPYSTYCLGVVGSSFEILGTNLQGSHDLGTGNYADDSSCSCNGLVPLGTYVVELSAFAISLSPNTGQVIDDQTLTISSNEPIILVNTPEPSTWTLMAFVAPGWWIVRRVRLRSDSRRPSVPSSPRKPCQVMSR